MISPALVMVHVIVKWIVVDGFLVGKFRALLHVLWIVL